MLRRFATLLSVALAAAPLNGQQFSVAARQQDLNYIATQVPRLHANFFYQLDPAVFQQAVTTLSGKISSLTDAEFYVQLAALIGLAGDPHTTIYLTGSQAQRAGFQTFPLQFRWLDDGVFVTASSSNYAQALGTQLVAVGGTGIDQVMQQMAAIIPHDNNQWLESQAQSYLAVQQVVQGLDVVAASAVTPLTFRTLAGNTFTLNVSAGIAAMQSSPSAANGPIPDYLTRTSSYYWYEYLAPQRILYFKYNVCENDANNPFSSFESTVLTMLDTNPVNSLVIDFRGNGGGSTSFFQDFGLQLAPRLPRLLSNANFRIYIVIDKGSFSSAVDDAMQFKSSDIPAELAALGIPSNFDFASHILVIGEPTGGAPSGYGEVVAFTLPGSGIVGQYSTAFVSAPTGIPPGPSFLPDIPVRVRSTDYFARYDPVLAAIMAGAITAPSAPSGTAVTVNGASFRADQGIAPGSIATAFGAFATPDQVLVGGAKAQIVSAAATQVNFIVPTSTPVGQAAISVRDGGSELANGTFQVTAAGPGIFVLNATDSSQPGAIENQDSSVNSSSTPAARGSVIQIFATGYGPLDASGAAAVQVIAGDTPAEVLYSAPVPQFPGLWQINAQLPAGVSGQVPIYLTASGLASNAVSIWIQ